MADELGEILGEEERSNVLLLISELVTNCVRHAGMTGPDNVITVHAGLTTELIRIEVCDGGPGFTPGTPRVRSFEQGGGGLGLVLLDRLSARWGAGMDEEFCVWAELTRDSEPIAA